MIDLNSLWVTQEELRCPIEPMIAYVLAGHKYPPLEIAEFEDGIMMLHNGHHRATAYYLAGKTTLNPDEYIVRKRKYDGYKNRNLAIGFVTPFDPKTEIRIADFRSIKCDILLAQCENRFDDAERMMIAERKYVMPRTIKTLPELAAKYSSINKFVNTVCENLYELSTIHDQEKKQDYFDWIIRQTDGSFSSGDFDSFNSVFERIDISRLSHSAIVALLRSTFMAPRIKLPARENFIKNEKTISILRSSREDAEQFLQSMS